jgi:aryl-alcohol dehydrogenase-like predicted oxidoreductase
MEMRNLGRTQIRVAPLAFGGNVFGWTVDERSAFTLLDKFTDAGFNLVDTADVYSRWVPGHLGGESETIIGRWLKHGGRRDAVVIATKVGMEMGPGKKGLSGKYIREAVEGSLRRLQTDYIDLYQSHEDDPSTPMEETLATYADLVKEGKIRAIGASNFSAERLLQALETSGQHGYPRYETLQPLYNLYERAEFESKLEPVCREHQLGVLCYYALASGFLTGKYRSERDLAQSPRGQGVKIHERTGNADPGGARPGGAALPGNAGAGCPGLADCTPKRYRTDRQRHQPGPVAGPDGGGRPQARPGSDGAAGPGQRLVRRGGTTGRGMTGTQPRPARCSPDAAAPDAAAPDAAAKGAGRWVASPGPVSC